MTLLTEARPPPLRPTRNPRVQPTWFASGCEPSSHGRATFAPPRRAAARVPAPGREAEGRAVAPRRAPGGSAPGRGAAPAPAAWLVYRVYFDRSGLPDLEPFIRFEPPTIGEVHDARGKALIELAREYRRVVSYDEVPAHPAPGHPGGRGQELLLPLRRGLRRAAAGGPEDGGALPGRMVERRRGFRLRLPQGGSTLTQQLVRAYFLRDRTSREDGDTLFRGGLTPSAALRGPGRPSHEQTSPEAGGGAPGALARGGDATALRIAGAGQARDLRPLRQLHLPGQRPLRLRRRLRVLLRQAPVELHSGGRGQGGAAGGDRQVAPGLRPGRRRSAAAAPPQRDPGPDGAQRLHPREPREALPGPNRSASRPSARSRPTPLPRSRTSSTS